MTEQKHFNKICLPKDHFIVPSKEGGYLLYVPLKGLLYLLDANTLSKVASFLTKKKVADCLQPKVAQVVEEIRSSRELSLKTQRKADPIPWNYLTLDLSTTCNLSCRYCYAESGDHARHFMTFDCAKSAIDLCISKVLSTKREPFLYLMFHGGSEPTVNWDLFVGVVKYARRQCKKVNFKLMVSMSTNGYYSVDKAKWLSKHLTNISLSLDGYEKIQNIQRPTRNGKPSFRIVFRSAKIFMDSLGPRFRFGLRPTITNTSVGHLPEVVMFFHNEFPKIGISIEPVDECGRCRSTSFFTPDPHLFVKKYIEVREKFPDVEIEYSGFNGIGNIRKKFCGTCEPQFAVLPSGLVTACFAYCHKELHRYFVYGAYDELKGTFLFNREKIDRLSQIEVNNYESCINCFAKYNCGGDCPALRAADNKINC